MFLADWERLKGQERGNLCPEGKGGSALGRDAHMSLGGRREMLLPEETAALQLGKKITRCSCLTRSEARKQLRTYPLQGGCT